MSHTSLTAHMYDYVVVIGRFQLPHWGHFDLLEEALKQGRKVIICIGSSFTHRTLRNPFTYEERKLMIEHNHTEKLENKMDRILFAPIEDSLYLENWWVEHVQRQVRTTILRDAPIGEAGSATIAIAGHSKDETSYYLKSFPQWNHIEVTPKQVYNSTDAREIYYKYGSKSNVYTTSLTRFTSAGIIDTLNFAIAKDVFDTLNKRRAWVEKYKEQWGEGPHWTGDAVILKSGHILLVTRGQEPDTGMWALPGGFRQGEESPYETAERECLEETGLDLSYWDEDVYGFPIIKTYQDPHRDDRGKIYTQATLFRLPDDGTLPEVKGADDAAHAEWVPISQLTQMNMFADHYHIVRHLTSGV